MRPTKVTFLVHEFPTLTETFILNQIVFLIENGIDVHIFSLYPGDFNRLHHQYQKYSLEKKVTYVAMIPHSPVERLREVFLFFRKQRFGKFLNDAVQCINPLNFGFSGLRLTHFLFYIRLMEIDKYDLVHAHFGIMGVFFSKFLKINIFKNLPLLVSFHGYDLVPSMLTNYAKLYKSMFNSATLFTVNSKYTLGLLNSIKAENSPLIKVLPMGVNTDLFNGIKDQKLEKTADFKRFKLVCVGRLISLKGADSAVDIVDIIIRNHGIKNLDLIIIGEGPLRVKINYKIQEKQLKENVILLGPKSQNEIKEILSEADLFIYTGKKEESAGRAEAQGLVVLEAQSMGVPVITFDVGGVVEGIIDGETGILVEPENFEAFASSVVNLLNDQNKRLAMGKSAREFVKEKFDSNVLGHKLIDIYQEVLQSN